MIRAEKEHTGNFNGSDLSYTSVCREYDAVSSEGNIAGTIFTYEYVKAAKDEEKDRPVLFAYNGGPGSSSLWLHMGMLAPLRINAYNFDADDPVHEPSLEKNERCLLDVCDIVVIDPLSTGYGEVSDEENAKECLGFEEDAYTIARVIESWIVDKKRYSSPKYLLGESYGTIRSTAVANILMGGLSYAGGMSRGISIDGIIMLGNCVSVERYGEDDYRKDFTESLRILPSLAATRQYYKTGTEAGFSDIMSEAYGFCDNDYLRALYLDQLLNSEQRRAAAEKVSQLTGLDADTISNRQLRVSCDDFINRYAEKTGNHMSPYDTRYSLRYINTVDELDCVAEDPLMGRLMPYYVEAFHNYEQEFLGLEITKPYPVINFTVNYTWKSEGEFTPFQHLQMLIRRNRNFRVMFSTGVYDLVTPAGDCRYTASRLAAEPGQVLLREYPSGHMLYIGENSFDMLISDIRAFITEE